MKSQGISFQTKNGHPGLQQKTFSDAFFSWHFKGLYSPAKTTLEVDMYRSLTFSYAPTLRIRASQ